MFRTSATLLFALFIAACSSKPDIVHSSGISTPPATRIYVVSHGWHTGIVIPAAPINRQLPPLQQRFNASPYIEFGWGDQGFYQANEITTGLTLRAILWPTRSVVHAVAVPASVPHYFANSRIESLCLQGDQFAKLLRFIENSFHRDDTGSIIPLSPGIYGNSQFYRGEGDYYLMNTCNKWTAKGLRSAGIDISPTFSLTADSVMDFLSARKKATANGADKCD